MVNVIVEGLGGNGCGGSDSADVRSRGDGCRGLLPDLCANGTVKKHRRAQLFFFRTIRDTPRSIFNLHTLPLPPNTTHQSIMHSISDYQEHQPEQWRVCDKTISPCETFTQSLNAFCAENRSDDFTIRFIFACSTASSPLKQDFIHASRLSFAKGPLAALLSTHFTEGATRTVTLCNEDDPNTFAIIRDFLYGLQIPLHGAELPHLLRVLRSAHRWQLNELFRVLCAFLSTHDMLRDAHTLLKAVDIIALPGLPDQFRDYFWENAAKFFMEFSPHPQAVEYERREDRKQEGERRKRGGELTTDTFEVDQNESCLPIQCKLCPYFPDMWDLALSHGAVRGLIEVIRRADVSGLNANLLDLVMRYLERQIEDDDEVSELIELLGPDAMREEYLLKRCGMRDDCSARAVRLLAKSLIAPRIPRNEMSFCWEVMLNTITPKQQNFLYGPCISARVPRNRWDPNLFEASSSIHFSVETLVNPGKQVGWSVRWDVGACFPYKGKRVELTLCMVRPETFGRERDEGDPMSTVVREVFKIIRVVDLTPKSCSFSGIESEGVFNAESQSSPHAARSATMMLRIRLMDE